MDRLASVPRTEQGPDGGDYQVRRLPSAVKEYTCPACLRPIPRGTPHVVAWPEEAPFGLPQGVEGRRHWHSDAGGVGFDPCEMKCDVSLPRLRMRLFTGFARKVGAEECPQCGRWT